MEKIDKTKFDDALIVFDTCSLGCIYTLTHDTQKCLVEILSYLKEQIWIPAQVKIEFSIHHKKCLYQAISDCYPLSTKVKGVEEYIETINKLLDETKKGTFHPYYSPNAQKKIFEAKERIINDVKSIEAIKKEQREIQKDLIDKTAVDDDLFALFQTLQVGEGFSIDELIQIAEDGAHRYKQSIPPGYMDEKEKQKHGLQKYGDLIIWKELIREAKKQSKNVIFVSEDVKEDWQNIIDGVDNGVRQELEEEFTKETGCVFYKYTLEQFISTLQSLYPEEECYLPLFGELTSVRFALQMKELQKLQIKKSQNVLSLRCECGHEFEVGENELCMEFEGDGYYERNMGPEYKYSAHEEIRCPRCRKVIELDMSVWEYPVGAYNCQSIECNGAEVLSELDLSQVIDFTNEDLGVCCECGERKLLMQETDMCKECWYKKLKELEDE